MGYFLHPFRPRFCLTEWHEISGYSFWSWLISVIGVLRSSSDNLIIGHIFGPAQVGIYSVGAEIAALPSSELVAPLCRAAFGGFAVARREGDNGAETFLNLLGLMALLTVPIGCGLSLVAELIVRLAFGPKWLGAVPLVQMLSVAGIFTLFGSVSATLFAANAWLKTMMRVNIAIAALRVTFLVILVPRMGIIGAAMRGGHHGHRGSTHLPYNYIAQVGGFVRRHSGARGAHLVCISHHGLCGDCLWFGERELAGKPRGVGHTFGGNLAVGGLGLHCGFAGDMVHQWTARRSRIGRHSFASTNF